MNPILQGLEEGYGEEEILSFISKSIPQMVPSIRKATKSGYGIKEILGFLSKNFDKESLKGKSESQIHAINRRADLERAKYGLKIAATAAAAPIAGIAARSALSRSLPSSIQKALPGIAGQSGMYNPSEQPQNAIPSGPTQQMPQQSDQLLDSSQQPHIVQDVTSVTQPKSISQPEIKTNMVDELWDSVNKGNVSRKDPELSAFLKIAKQLKDYRGLNTKERFEQLYNKFQELQGKALGLSEIGRQLSAANEEIIGQKLESVEQPSQELDVPKEEIKRPQIAKSETVSTPHGIGEVKEIRNGQAIIDVGGKLHKVKEEELEASPLPEKELSELYDDLIKGIEGATGEDVSRMVQWAGYNPEMNTLQFLPHTGKLYKYSNISPEDAALLTDILSTRKTSGENFIGAWKAGSKSPIGAALSKLIRKLQSERGGKGNEYEETHEPIYSAYEPAIQAAKKKKKKK